MQGYDSFSHLSISLCLSLFVPYCYWLFVFICWIHWYFKVMLSILIVIISTPRFLKFLHVPKVFRWFPALRSRHVPWVPLRPSVLPKGPSAGITRASWVCHYPAFSLEPWMAWDFTNMAGDFMGTHGGFMLKIGEISWKKYWNRMGCDGDEKRDLTQNFMEIQGDNGNWMEIEWEWRILVKWLNGTSRRFYCHE